MGTSGESQRSQFSNIIAGSDSGVAPVASTVLRVRHLNPKKKQKKINQITTFTKRKGFGNCLTGCQKGILKSSFQFLLPKNTARYNEMTIDPRKK
ncbi:MAG: hypothetical protein ABIJ23_00335 [Candidatus Magasanikbacteria bacterium]